MKKLTEQETQDRMKEMDAAWKVKGEFLHLEFFFKDFFEAFSFMSALALLPEIAANIPIGKTAITS
jgi:4a-hydroxytetrahydrobiopterin dehydratase